MWKILWLKEIEMDDFYRGGVIAFFVVLLIISALSLGYDVKESAIEDTCASYSKFTINDSIYECKLIENKSK